MTSREVVTALVRDKECPERMGVHESFWPDLRPTWEREGLPTGASFLDYFDLDIHPVNEEWFSTEPLVGAKHVVAEDDTTYVEENGWGSRMRFWKNKAGTPEHVSFGLGSEDAWRRLREPLRGFDERRLGDAAKLRAEHGRLARGSRFRVFEVLQLVEIMRKAMGDVVMLEAMCLAPAWITDFCTVLTDNIITHLDRALSLIGRPDGIWFYEDLAFSRQPFFSPEMYRGLIMPHHARFVRFCHDLGLPVFMHTCGNVEPLFPDLLSIGIDCLQPLEVKAGMDVGRLARSATRRIAYIGGMDVRAFETNDPARLEAEVLPKLAAIRRARVPYICQSDHSIPGTVRLSTYRHARELFRQQGRYEEAN